jgi:hypothetical protein
MLCKFDKGLAISKARIEKYFDKVLNHGVAEAQNSTDFTPCFFLFSLTLWFQKILSSVGAVLHLPWEKQFHRKNQEQ